MCQRQGMSVQVSPAGTGNGTGTRGRLTLLPGLRRLWRDDTAVQLGADPARAIVIELPDPKAARVLDLLDGSRTERTVLRDARALGVPRDVASAILAALRTANLVVGSDALMPPAMPEAVRRRLVSEAASIAMSARPHDIPGVDGSGYRGEPTRRRTLPAEAIRRRAAASVQVTGASRLVVPIASTLARAGVGHVDPAMTGRVGVYDDAVGGFTPADTNRPRGTAASEAVLRAAPFTDTRAMRTGGASFVVQIGQGVPAELAAYAYARKSLAHLLIEERDDTVLIGPLVPPAGSPCLRCLDLHRRDRDPAWPALVAQLATSVDAAPSVSTATSVIAVGVAVAQVLAYLDGEDVPTIGASIEVSTPSTLRRRSWAAHPRCDCASRTRRRRRTRAS